MLCPKCRQEVPGGLGFCVHCGHDFQPETPAATPAPAAAKAERCPDCGAGNPPEAPLCTLCGRELPAARAAAPAAGPAAAVSRPGAGAPGSGPPPEFQVYHASPEERDAGQGPLLAVLLLCLAGIVGGAAWHWAGSSAPAPDGAGPAAPGALPAAAVGRPAGDGADGAVEHATDAFRLEPGDRVVLRCELELADSVQTHLAAAGGRELAFSLLENSGAQEGVSVRLLRQELAPFAYEIWRLDVRGDPLWNARVWGAAEREAWAEAEVELRDEARRTRALDEDGVPGEDPAASWRVELSYRRRLRRVVWRRPAGGDRFRTVLEKSFRAGESHPFLWLRDPDGDGWADLSLLEAGAGFSRRRSGRLSEAAVRERLSPLTPAALAVAAEPFERAVLRRGQAAGVRARLWVEMRLAAESSAARSRTVRVRFATEPLPALDGRRRRDRLELYLHWWGSHATGGLAKAYRHRATLDVAVPPG